MKKYVLILLALALIAPASNARQSKKKQKAQAEAQLKANAEKNKQAEKPTVDRKGLFNVIRKKGDWMMEIPRTLLGKDILTTTRYISTPAGLGKFGGEECNEQVVYFELTPDTTLLLRTRMLVNLADSTDAISRAVTVSTENPIIGAFRLEGKKDSLLRFKVNEFLMGDYPLDIHKMIKQNFQLTNLDRGLSFIQDIRTYPTNTEIRLVRTYNSGNKKLPSAAQTGKATFVINTSFILLPENPMPARLFDLRVGYFTNSFTQYSDSQQRVKNQTMITRWRLEPKDSTDAEKLRHGELVEPKKPIIYYIDPATPEQWRPYLIAGVNDWQKAFEKAGWKNAIHAEMWPDSDSTMSMEDARYSVIRYLASPIENAYGPHVSDPRTGEILESHICWYHNVMRLVHDWYMVQAGSIDEAARRMHYSTELMGELIRFVSSHEVGHTLGLRHNFGSSSTVPTDSLRNKAWVENHGHTPSIMDYARFNYVAQPGDGITAKGIFPRINDYDEWAIKWGYKASIYLPQGGEAYDPMKDHLAMETETEKAQKNPRLWWGDGETTQDDPRRQREDLGNDAVKSSYYGMLNLKRDIKQLPEWTKDSTDIYDKNLDEMFGQIRSQYIRYIGHVSRYIGGTYETFRTRQQGGTKYQPTPLQKQKQAFQFLVENAIQEPVWMRQVSYAGSLTGDPRELTLPVATKTAELLVGRIGETNTLYTDAQFADDIVAKAFTQYQSKTLSLYTRTLQQELVSKLLNNYSSGEDNATYLYAIKKIWKICQSAQSSAPDATSRAHYMGLADNIRKALEIK